FVEETAGFGGGRPGDSVGSPRRPEVVNSERDPSTALSPASWMTTSLRMTSHRWRTNVTLRFIPRFRLAAADLRADDLWTGRDGDPQRHHAHQVCRVAHQADLLGPGWCGDDVSDQPGQLPGAARQNPLVLHCGNCIADGGNGLWAEIPGGAALDQDAGRQPLSASEWVKLILILAVAKYFAELRHRDLSWPDFIKAGAIVGIPMLMVLAQPDLGTALTYVPIAVMGVFLGGMQWKQGVLVAVLAGVGVGAVFLVPRVHVLKSY